ncbi:Putative ubiquitin carboxyl-terminal hydrolase FAF-X [Fukomys damarensis]|uniref:ubiquitinyl hydrolase 1 n=1 Tax=Fukomys damarensis TaxID=885580 RepID=A0A091E5J1_FUKDA|nr:Putative ubiquitin carboxyl-terminal hydrolase FAF-X [Fukomys damarensis]
MSMTTTAHGSPLRGSDSHGQTPDGQSQPPFQVNQTSSPDSSNENSPETPPEQGQGDAPKQNEDEEPAFPHIDLANLDYMINRSQWMVPVLPKGELEVLLEASIDLSKKGLDVKSEACQRFFRDGLTVSFTKILLDEGVNRWKFEIHEWIQQKSILSIVLKDSLHQPQYVEKLEKILQFVIKEEALTLQDLDNIWAAQASWTNANKTQREKLLELISRLAEDDKDGVMAHKVLNLLWNLARSDDVPVDIMDAALSAHTKILNCSCSQLDPTLLTENGIKCFERFFKAVNCKEGKLVAKRRGYMMDDLELIGLDYLWRVVIQSNDDIACRAIDLLKEICTNLGPRLQSNQVIIHENFIQSCFDRLKASYNTLCVLDGDKDSNSCTRQETIHMVRVLTVLREYINECDSDYQKERMILPMSRAFRGKHLSFIVRFPNQRRHDLDIPSHTNDTVGSIRRCILNQIKANVARTKVELFVDGELLDSLDDRKLIGQLNLKDKSLITAKLTQINSNVSSRPDSPSAGPPRNHQNLYSDDPNPEVESCLPGVVSNYCLQKIILSLKIGRNA